MTVERASFAREVAAALGRPASDVERVDPVGGGSISDAACVELRGTGRVFAKSAAGLADTQLEVEAEALRWLGEVDGVPIPDVLAVDDAVLVLAWVPPGSPTATTGELLGAALARLHAARWPEFGWHRDGFIGREPQANTPTSADWLTFWIDRRVEPFADRAVRRRALDPQARPLVAALREVLPERAGPTEGPVRVHGDLWSGNVHVDEAGDPWLVDPAAYAGHREVDLAMLHLFGDPGASFVAAYDEALPLADGWRERLALWQLEPLLVHAVLFGGGYGASALRILERFGR